MAIELPFMRNFSVPVKAQLHRMSSGWFFMVLWLFSGFQTTGMSFSLHGRDGGGSVVTPYIESIKYNTTVFAGQTAYLPCVVKHLGDKTVSWIRRRDLHILTSGNHVYTSDPRVSLIREGKLLNSWTLKIVSVQKKDEGSYECQVNTEPKMTLSLHLVVFGIVEDEAHSGGGIAMGMLDSPLLQLDSNLDPNPKGYEAKILGPLHQELEEGDMANFTCLISHGGPPPNVTWFLNDVPVHKASTLRGGINIETEKSPFSTISKLVIVKLHRDDEGKYSCGGTAVYPASLSLHVIHTSDSRHGSVNELMPMISIANSARLPFSRPKGPNPQDKEKSERRMHFLLISLPTFLLSSFGFGPFPFLYLLFSLSSLSSYTDPNRKTSSQHANAYVAPVSHKNDENLHSD